ncbi:MAG: hypothetical protein AAF297_00445 [Planctomycetota bacterium]
MPHLQLLIVMAAAAAGSAATAQTIDLAGLAGGDGRLSEFDLTGAFAQIDFGDGTPGDADGAYLLADSSGPLGTALDVFPNETSFGLGGLTFDDTGLSGVGAEAAPATALDLGDLWNPGSPSADLSAVAISNFFFGAPVSLAFGALDAADVVQFVDGQLDSVNLEVDAALTIDYSFGGGAPTVYNGLFAISGDAFTLLIDETVLNIDTAFGPAPQSRLRLDLGGQVLAIPAPAGVVCLGLLGLVVRRRRSSHATRR